MTFFTPEQRRCAELGRQKQRDWFNLRDKGEWSRQEAFTAEKVDLIVDCLTSKAGFNTFKATGSLPYPAEVIYNCIVDPEVRKMYAKNEDIVKPIQKECTNTITGYQCSKKVGVWPLTVDPREFVVTSHHDVLPSGVISICAYSDPQKQKLEPITKAFIRG